jgi:signal transduction histidine kinase
MTSETTSIQTTRRQRGFIAILAALPLFLAAILIPFAHSHLPFDHGSLSILGRTMLVSALVAWLLAYAGLTLSQRVPQAGLRAQLAIPVLVGSLTALAGTMFTAWMMLVTHRDLMLLAILLAFAALIALPISWLSAHLLASRVGEISRAAKRMAEGELSTRAESSGQDEIGELAQSFNQMAEELERAQQRQAAIERARKEMLVAISHDLRTPLSSVQAMGEAIVDRVVDESTAHQYIQQILNETHKLEALISDLFELSQIDVGNLRLQFESCDLRDLLSDTLNAMQMHAEQRGVLLQGEFSHAVRLVHADPMRIQRVLSNLIQNSLHHTESGDRIVVEVKNEPSGGIRLSVSDTGCGIDPALLPQIFDSFYRVDQARSDGGAGLGLTIARGIVEAHGGTISAESEPGVGTTISFTLPRSSHL